MSRVGYLSVLSATVSPHWISSLWTRTLMVGSTPSSQNDTQDDQPGNSQNLDGSKPKLGFTIDTCTGEIDGKDDDEADGDPDTVFGGVGVPAGGTTKSIVQNVRGMDLRGAG